jgi:4-hydroxy-3-polyprenylbenzoate decarboxylase
MILDATSFGRAPLPPTNAKPPIKLHGPGGEVLPCRNWRDTLLVVQVKDEGRDAVEWLVQEKQLSGFKLIAAVSPDVPLDDDELLLWGLFTRFDCARDVVPGSTQWRGVWPQFPGPLGIDATWKAGYPKPLTMTESIVRRVDERWKEYGL